MIAQPVEALRCSTGSGLYPTTGPAPRRPVRIALVGPDGVDKSPAIATLKQWFQEQLSQVAFEVRQWRPDLLPDLGVFLGKPSTPGHKTPPRRPSSQGHLLRTHRVPLRSQNERLRRREMVFVNDVAYTKVLSKSALVANSFYVAEDEALLYIRTPAAFDLKPATVEVSVRPILFHAQGKTNLLLRGLSFIRGNRPVPDPAFEIIDSRHVEVDDCQFRWNNWDGFQISTSSEVTALRNTANNNGASGMGGFQLKNALYSDNEWSFNNRRGAAGGFYGWAVAGAKFGALHGAVFRNQRSEHNQTRGFWFDYDDAQILIENASWSNNLRDSVFIEANQGPILIRGSTLSNNGNGAGVSGASSSDVTLAQNVISGNELAQIQITGDFDRQVTNWETNSAYTLRAERWTLTCNAIASTAKSQALLETPNWPHFLNTVKSQKNTWFTATNPFPFKVGALQFTYAVWKGATAPN